MKLRLRSRLRLLSILQVNGLSSQFARKKPLPAESCICKNCGNHYEGKFCPHCGQKSNTRRLTFLNMLEDGFELLTNVDSGILRSVTELFWRPGYMIRDYINGKRKGYMKPLSMLFCLSTFYYAFVWLVSRDSFFDFAANDQEIVLPDSFDKFRPLIELARDYFTQWINNPGLATLTIILPMAPSAWLCFRKTRYGKVFNMMEHFHIQIFQACQMLIITIIKGIVLFVTTGHLELLDYGFTECLILFTWDFKQLFDISWKRSLRLTILCLILSFFVFLLILIVLGLCAAAVYYI